MCWSLCAGTVILKWKNAPMPPSYILLCIRVTTGTTCQTAANKVHQEMIKQKQCVYVRACVCACVCVCVCVCVFESHYHSSPSLQLPVTD